MDAFFFLAGPIVVLVLLSMGTSLGIVFIALSRTGFVQAVPVVSVMFLPVLLVVYLSGFGHLKANEVAITDWKLAIPIGLAITFLVILRRRHDIYGILCTRVTSFSALAGLFSLSLFLYLNSTTPFAYNYLGNGEFLNYSRLASVMISPDPSLAGFLTQHRSLRYGQDIFLAVVADFFGKNPIELVHITSGYLLFAYGAAIGFVVATIFGTNKFSLLLLLIHGMMLTVIFNFTASFFSSTVTLSTAILILAYSVSSNHSDSSIANTVGLFALARSTVGIIFLATVSIVFYAITYPEFGVPVFCAAVGFAGLQSLISRKFSKALFSLAIAIAVSFLLVWPVISHAFSGFFGQLTATAGWNVFGDPHVDLVRFLLNIVGLSFALATHHFSTNNFVNWGIIFGLIVVVGINARFALLASNPGIKVVLVVWSATAILVVLSPFATGRNWYPAVKYFSQFQIGIILLIGLNHLSKRKEGKFLLQKVVPLRMFLLLGIFLATGIFEVAFAKKEIVPLVFGKWATALKSFSNANLPLAVFKDHQGEVIWFAEIVGKDSTIALLPVSTSQISRLARQSPSLLPARCISNKFPVDQDLSSWPHPARQLLAVVDAGDAEDEWLKSDQGFDVKVTNREVVARLDGLRIDRVKLGTITEFSFHQDSWAVDGIWSACVVLSGDYNAIKIEVPKLLVDSEPLNLEVYVGDEIRQFKIVTSGPHMLPIGIYHAEGISELVSIKTSRTWMPRNIDSSSADARKLGVKVLALTVGERT